MKNLTIYCPRRGADAMRAAWAYFTAGVENGESQFDTCRALVKLLSNQKRATTCAPGTVRVALPIKGRSVHAGAVFMFLNPINGGRSLFWVFDLLAKHGFLLEDILVNNVVSDIFESWLMSRIEQDWFLDLVREYLRFAFQVRYNIRTRDARYIAQWSSDYRDKEPHDKVLCDLWLQEQWNRTDTISDLKHTARSERQRVLDSLTALGLPDWAAESVVVLLGQIDDKSGVTPADLISSVS